MSDNFLPARRAMLAALKADSAMTALVPAASIHPQSPGALPTWPFIRFGSPSAVPIVGACLDGAEITVAIHGFAKARMVNNQVVESAEDHAGRIGTQIGRTLGRCRLTLDDGGSASVRWTGAQLLQDGDEADAFHSVTQFRVRILG